MNGRPVVRASAGPPREIDLMCFELMPRHHNIARFRMGRPFPLDPRTKAALGADYMLHMFKEACHWSSFTLNYIEWTYEYFVLDPPVPINCPIQGKFKFVQTGQEAEKYVFKMPNGMTPRPWLQSPSLLLEQMADIMEIDGRTIIFGVNDRSP
ncbi:unnamed protein product [Dibothriocephalus latus]|uniref:Uncharacterized protein n=1 Tax=Dibothriocephalus latus TaxID=60516 RepID=A0A3P7QAU5_DIBLA|nr:unnamed protein product [Dibothriocephalus latus]